MAAPAVHDKQAMDKKFLSAVRQTGKRNAEPPGRRCESRKNQQPPPEVSYSE